MRVLVIGGGVAGSATAIALHRAGIDAEIYERHPGVADDVGLFLTFAGNGIDALQVLGAAEPVEKTAFPTPRMVMRSGTGRVLGSMSNGDASRTIRRADLYRVLRDEVVRRGIPIHYGKALADVEPSATGVRARFGDGTDASGDLLVGADGLHSPTRNLIDPDAPAPRYVPVLNTGGYARGVAVDAEPGTFTMVFGKRAFFGYVPAPNGEVWWFANPPYPTAPSAAELAGMNAGGAWRRRLLELYADDATPAVALIEASTNPMTGWATYDLPAVPNWYRDRMVLVGDAAHATSPSSGQGASMAIEDAVVLAKSLRDVPDRAEALATYVGIRRPRVERVVKAGARSSSMKVAGPVGRVVRDAMMPLFLPMASRMMKTEWMHRYHIDWDVPVSAA
ncbi:FAD-dependent monooxygenase [Cryptosporangium arvum]|uniref:2-polyprenyl-6-methoxyphenol hydroxylase-like oxidoreductase n=1 Tax=Cryptosporangium arvum DSM 44712 TaxID=927661 RepID=A0A010ZMK1_9ACTN|nr:FAD-dependent monooxygenase [Cryptosporangium arvum]EXG79904.1 2-polyprenyl-6-methoxyphenol hydroxylase-like oxidoreductase [Cryptosporangium arvum DSM 44712]